MVEMLSYIFRSLQASESAVKSINRTLRKQARFNKTVTTFALVTAAQQKTNGKKQSFHRKPPF